MKPEQFIREYGVDKAREVVEGAPEGTTHYDIPFEVYLRSTEFWNGSEWKAVDDFTIQDLELPPYVDIPDLKRLVESVELISFFGSIKIAKDKVKMADFNGFLLVSVPIENGLADVYIHKVEQAIRDHESIYGGGDE
ncbi:hypothetical protein KWF57_18525 [Acinetobacter baumannii]